MRRKAKHILIGIGLMCVFLCSCSGYPVEGDLPAGQSELYFMYDVDEVEAPDETSVWSAQWIEWDNEILCDTLLRQEPVTMDDNPFGLSIYAGNENSNLEILTIGERGKLQEGGIDYGISFQSGIAGVGEYQEIVSLSGWHPDRVTQLYRYNDNADFSDQELGIMSSDEALQIVQEILENCGMSEMRNVVMLSLDADTLNRHEDMRKAHWDEDQKKRDELSEEMPKESQEESQSVAGWKWTEKDAAYYMRYVQTVENIPVINHEWCSDSSDLYTDVSALVNTEGLLDLRVSHIVNPIEQGDRAKIITPSQAQELLREYYNQTVIDNPIWVESQCLYYISLRDDKADIKLIPAWVFCIAREYEYDDEPGVMLMDYSHYVIDAITGEHLLSADV